MDTGGCTHLGVSFPRLPAEVSGWRPAGPDRTYDANNLFDYIDGSAEVYRAFNVRRVLARHYVREGEPDIIADLFDMGSPADAFGAYHHDMREGEDIGIGQESEEMKGALAFWKGNYFVSLTAFDHTAAGRDAMRRLGRAVADAIPEAGAPPDIVQALPEAGMLRNHLHYFHGHLCLNIYYFLADGNPLNLDKTTEGVVARYAPPSSGAGGASATPHVVMVIRYPDADKARAAHLSFRRAYMPDADESGGVETENGTWAGTRLAGNYLIGVFDAPTRGHLQTVLREVDHQLGGLIP